MLEISDLWESEDWVDLPEDGPEAFARLVTLARPRFRQKLESCNDNQMSSAMSHRYMTILIAIAKEHSVLPFLHQKAVYLRHYTDDIGDDFESDIALFLAQQHARKAKRVAEGMVTLSVKERGSIQARILALREKLQETPMEAWRKKRLMAKLDELEADLGKGRVNIANAAMFAAMLISLPGGVNTTMQAMGIDFQNDVLAPIVEARCQAEKEEWVQKALPAPKPKMLPHPKSIAAFPSPKPR